MFPITDIVGLHFHSHLYYLEALVSNKMPLLTCFVLAKSKGVWRLHAKIRVSKASFLPNYYLTYPDPTSHHHLFFVLRCRVCADTKTAITQDLVSWISAVP
ncbi:hypothetical protein XPA_007520 [Xanthoria parietina]